MRVSREHDHYLVFTKRPLPRKRESKACLRPYTTRYYMMNRDSISGERRGTGISPGRCISRLLQLRDQCRAAGDQWPGGNLGGSHATHLSTSLIGSCHRSEDDFKGISRGWKGKGFLWDNRGSCPHVVKWGISCRKVTRKASIFDNIMPSLCVNMEGMMQDLYVLWVKGSVWTPYLMGRVAYWGTKSAKAVSRKCFKLYVMYSLYSVRKFLWRWEGEGEIIE